MCLKEEEGKRVERGQSPHKPPMELTAEAMSLTPLLKGLDLYRISVWF